MILGQTLAHFLTIWLSIIAIVVVASLLPFIVRRLRPQSYRGFWQLVGGTLLKSPERALMFPLGYLLGLGFAIAVFYDWELTTVDVVGLWLMALSVLAVSMGIVLGWRLYKLERRRNGPSRDQPRSS